MSDWTGWDDGMGWTGQSNGITTEYIVHHFKPVFIWTTQKSKFRKKSAKEENERKSGENT